MITIWKFKIPRPDVNGISVVEMPKDARPISVAALMGWLYVYAEASYPAYEETAEVVLAVVNTGMPFERREAMRFLGTAAVVEVVWHVYVIEDPP